jgi:hypothetical protein
MSSNTQPKNWTRWKRYANEVCSKKTIPIFAYYNCSLPKLSNYMDPGYSWEASSSPVSPEISCILWNQKVFYVFHKITTVVPVLIRSVPSTTSHLVFLRFVVIFSSHLLVGPPSGLFPSGYPTKTTYVLIFCPICATRPVPLIIFNFITKMAFD